jgi:hypothetical protein
VARLIGEEEADSHAWQDECTTAGRHIKAFGHQSLLRCARPQSAHRVDVRPDSVKFNRMTVRSRLRQKSERENRRRLVLDINVGTKLWPL